MEVGNFLKVLDHYGVQYVDYGETYRMCCPLHNGKNPTSFTLRKDNALWFCHADCNTGGDLLNFIMLKEDIGFSDAVSLLASLLDVATRDIQIKQGVGLVEQNTQRFLELVKSMDQDLAEYEIPKGEYYNINSYRSFNKEVLNFFDMKYAKQFRYVKRDGTVSQLNNRLIFPLYQQGKLVGITIRRVNNNDFPKWMHLPQGLHTKNILYNLDNIVPFEPIIVVEGVLDVWKWHSMGFTNTVATLGSNLSNQQENLLLQNTDTLYFCYDGDDAGKDAFDKIQKQIKYKFNLFSIDLPDGSDPCDLSDEDLLMCYENRRRVI